MRHKRLNSHAPTMYMYIELTWKMSEYFLKLNIVACEISIQLTLLLSVISFFSPRLLCLATSENVDAPIFR